MIAKAPLGTTKQHYSAEKPGLYDYSAGPVVPFPGPSKGRTCLAIRGSVGIVRVFGERNEAANVFLLPREIVPPRAAPA